MREVRIVVDPDPERDARVAARRAADAARAGRALDELLGPTDSVRDAYAAGWRDGYAASEIQHNDHYVVSDPGYCGNRVEHSAHPWSDYGVPMQCRGLAA